MKKKFKLVILGIFIGILFCLIPSEIFTPYLIIAIGLGFAILLKGSKNQDREIMFKIFLTAFLLRVVLAMASYYVSFLTTHPGYLLGKDDFNYGDTAWKIAQNLRNGVFPDYWTVKLKMSLSGTVSLYEYLIAILFFFIGYSPVSVILINSFFSAVSALLLYQITKDIFGPIEAKIAALFACFWPSILFWSMNNLKEPLTIFLSVLSIWLFMKYRQRSSIITFFLCLIVIFSLLLFRPPLAAMIILSVIITMFITSKRFPILVFSLVVFCIIWAIFTMPGFNFIKNFILQYGLFADYNHFDIYSILEQAQSLRVSRAIGNSALFPNFRIDTPLNALIFFPIGVSSVLFSPFPWQATKSIFLMFATFENLIWYILIFFILVGFLYTLRYRLKENLVILFFICSLIISMAYLEGNSGTIFRHRAVIIFFLFMYLSKGFIHIFKPIFKKLI